MSISDLIKKEKVILFGLIILFSLIFVLLVPSIKSQWAQDSHWHMSLVENLAAGKGYTTDGISPHGKYPPGLALLILPFYLIFQNINFAGLLVMYLFSVFSIILTYKLSKEIFGFKVAILSSFILVFHNLFIFNSVSIMTETPFMFFSIACLYFFMKSFDKHMFILPSLISFSFAVLIRYDGIFLVFPIIFYVYFRISELRNLIFSNIFIFSFISSFFIISLWFIRNFFVFGSFFYTDYTRELTSFSIGEFFSFILLFFKTGYLFPLLAALGLGYSIIKFRKDPRLMTILVWFVAYIVLHSIWSARAFRFYGEIILILCIFAAIGVSQFSDFFNSAKIKRIVTLLLLILIILEQIFIFYTGSINYETTSRTINRYESINELSSWANENIRGEAVYAVPDVAVYSLYLKESNIIYFNQGLSLLVQNLSSQPIYFFTDTLHSWMTGPIVNGIKSGKILLPVSTPDGNAILHLTPVVIKELNYFNKSTAYIFRINNVSIEKS